LVAGSNPARGAKTFKHLAETSQGQKKQKIARGSIQGTKIKFGPVTKFEVAGSRRCGCYNL
jgi:hypothetical protein